MAKSKHSIGKASAIRSDFDEVLRHFRLERPGGSGYVAAHQKLLLYRPKKGRVQFVNFSKASQIVQMRMSQSGYTSSLTGQFIKRSEVQSLLDHLNSSSTPSGFWGRENKYKPSNKEKGQRITFQVHGDLEGMIPRLNVLIEESYIVGKFLEGEVNLLLNAHVPKLQEVIAQRIRRNVYKTPVTLIYYLIRGKPREQHEYQPGVYARTFNLLRAFTEGITVNGTQLNVGINEQLAPYWMWVEKGHRVYFGDEEVGTFVQGRPFKDDVRRDVQEYIQGVLVPDINTLLGNAASQLTSWVANGKPMQLDPKLVKHIPAFGYGKEFQQWTGQA